MLQLHRKSILRIAANLLISGLKSRNTSSFVIPQMSRIFRLKADVAQIVEHREERDLRKLGDAGDEDKLLVFVICLENGKNLSIDSGTCFVLRSLPGMLQWRVVFIDENGNLLVRFCLYAATIIASKRSARLSCLA